MKTVLCWTLVLVALMEGAAVAQTLAGNWPGTLQAGRELRVVFTISNADGGALRGVMYSIDQGVPGIPVGAITQQGTTVRMSSTPINHSHQRGVRRHAERGRSHGRGDVDAGRKPTTAHLEACHARDRLGDP